MDNPIVTILLLGSFDPQTKAQLEDTKEEIVKTFSGENVYALLLDSVEVYFSDVVEVLTELIAEDRITLFTFQDNQLVDMEELKLEKDDADKTIYDYLKKKHNITGSRTCPCRRIVLPHPWLQPAVVQHAFSIRD